MTNEDLKARLLDTDHNWHEAACHEAADAIERLEAEVALVTNERSRMIDRYERLEAENARLREALGEVINAWDEPYYGDLDARCDWLFNKIETARAALEKHHD